MSLCELLRADNHSSSSVIDTGSVACGYGAVLLECRTQLAQNLKSGARLRMLVGVEDNGLLAHLNLDRNDLVLELASLDCSNSLLLGCQSDLVLHLTGDAVLLSYVLSGDAHVVVVEYVPNAVVDHHIDHLDVVHTSAPAHVAGDVRSRGHRLSAACQHALNVAGLNHLCCQRHCSHGGTADLVDGHCRSFDRQTCTHHCLTSDVLTTASGKDLTEYNLVDCSLVDACALNSSGCSSNCQGRSGNILQGAAVGADCGSCSTTNVNVHFTFLLFVHRWIFTT